ncbi:MAG: NUDIX domain-containing protein, partial [Clostridiales bacterium]|nr:NUDIX domain-containing protein [Clostridiales bacterium]
SFELGESFEEGAKREALEETGLECIDLQYFTHSSGKEMHYTYPNQDEVYLAEMVFLCTRYKGELKVQKSEATEQRFFDLDKLPKEISPVNQKTILKFVEYMKSSR